jgi:hypothetical protein
MALTAAATSPSKRLQNFAIGSPISDRRALGDVIASPIFGGKPKKNGFATLGILPASSLRGSAKSQGHKDSVLAGKRAPVPFIG